MSRSPMPLVLAFLAVALVAVPAALAKGRDDRAVRIQGVCSQQSTSKLKLSREDRGIEVEFEVDQNRNGVPWNVVLSRNGKAVASFTATTRAPSGSFEIRRVLAGRLGVARIAATATSPSGEKCTAASAASTAKAAAAPTANRADDNGADDNGADDNGHDAGDDHGHHSGGHS
jgi:hypothetical protein